MPSFNKIFHPTDFSSGDIPAWLHSVIVATKGKGTLTLFHVGSSEANTSSTLYPRLMAILTKWGYLPEGAESGSIKKMGLEFKRLEIAGDDPAQSILEYISQNPTDLVVLATKQTMGLIRLVKSPTVEPIAFKCKAPTLFVPRDTSGFIDPDTGKLKLKNILVPVCHSPNPNLSVEAAVELSLQLGCEHPEIYCVFVGPENQAPSIDAHGSDRYTVYGEVLEKEEPVEEILKMAVDIDAQLIVMATDGPQGFLDGLRGTTAQQIVRRAKCPVLMINCSNRDTMGRSWDYRL